MEKSKLGMNILSADVTLPHNLDLTIKKIFKGQPGIELSGVTIGGCGVRIPEVGETGIFFNDLENGLIPVFKTEGVYEQTLYELGKLLKGSHHEQHNTD